MLLTQQMTCVAYYCVFVLMHDADVLNIATDTCELFMTVIHVFCFFLYYEVACVEGKFCLCW